MEDGNWAGFSGKTASVLNHRDIFPAPICQVKKKKKNIKNIYFIMGFA